MWRCSVSGATRLLDFPDPIPQIAGTVKPTFPGLSSEIPGTVALKHPGLSPKIPGTVTTLVPGCIPGIPETRMPKFRRLVPEIPETQAPVHPAASADRSVSGTVYWETLNATSTLPTEVEKVNQEAYGVSMPTSEGGQSCTSVQGKPNAHPLTFWLDLEYVLASLPHKYPGR